MMIIIKLLISIPKINQISVINFKKENYQEMSNYNLYQEIDIIKNKVILKASIGIIKENKID
jgi:hypothetical protein